MHRTFLKRATAVAAGLGLSTLGVLAMAPPASAGEVAGVGIDPASAPIILNSANQSAGDLTLTLTNAANAGDTIDVTIAPSGSSCITAEDAAEAISWAAVPTDDKDNVTGELKDECAGGTVNITLRLTIGTGGLAANATIKLSNIKYNVPSIAPEGPVQVHVNDILPPNPADSNATVAAVRRVAGTTRFETAGKIAAAAGDVADEKECAEEVVVVNGQNFPDALAAAALGKPILMVNPTSIPAETSKAITDLGVGDITIVGGTGAVSSDLFNTLDALKETKCADPDGDQTSGADVTVHRIGDLNRYSTARAVTAQVTGTQTADSGLNGGNDCVKTAILVSGENYPDALAAGALAYGGPQSAGNCQSAGNHIPIVLTTPTALRPEAQEALSALAPKQVIVLGGTTAISTAVTDAVDALPSVDLVKRIAGTTRQETAADFADELKDQGFGDVPPHGYLVASGVNFPDALAGASLASIDRSPILLSSSATALGTSARDVIHDSTVLHVFLLGGTTALNDSVGADVGTALK